MWGIWAIRSPNSRMGYAASWVKRDGVDLEFETKEEAEAEAKRLNEKVATLAVTYFAERRA